jgi:GT2 family glycosyltransferase
MTDLDDVDFVALVNSDAFVAPGWLDPLVAAFSDQPGLGAACPRIVFAPRFHELRVTTDGWSPANGDPRSLGVRIDGIRREGQDIWAAAVWSHGVFAPEVRPEDGSQFRWTAPEAELWLPAASGGDAAFELLVGGRSGHVVNLICDGAAQTIEVGAEPRWVEVTGSGSGFDVVNNVGSRLSTDWYGADRGYGERDVGQYDQPSEVFAWCGAAVLLSANYLRDAGIFDDAFFLYYEDTDLSWRGRCLGWRYGYVPDAVVRHVHAASSVEGSPLFERYVKRNRLLAIARNAPAGAAIRELGRFARDLAILTRDEMIHPLSHGRRPKLTLLPTYWAAARGFVRLLPGTVRARRTVSARRRLRRDAVVSWAGRP